MTGLVCLVVAFSAFTALAVWLDHVAFDPFDQYRVDPRDLVDRAHQWGDES